MKFTKLFLLLCLAFMVTLVSCDKDNIDDITPVDPVDPVETESNALVNRVQLRTTGGLDLGCFTIQTPFNVVHESGAISTINNEDDFFTALESTDLVVDFVYPLNIEDLDGTISSIADAMELGNAFALCIPDSGYVHGIPAFLIDFDNSCYELQYPLTLTDLDGNTVTAADKEELIDLLAANADLYFTYPLSLIDEDGNVQVANDEEELFFLLSSCDGIHPPCDSVDLGGLDGIGCYSFVYPFNAVNPAGEIFAINDSDEFFEALFSGEFVNFSYPLTLEDAAGNLITINSEEDLTSALEDCGFGPGPGIDIFLLFDFSEINQGCFSISYPISMNMSDNSTIVVNDNDEYIQALGSYDPFVEGLVYPLDVTVLSSSTVVTLNNQDDLLSLIENCQ